MSGLREVQFTLVLAHFLTGHNKGGNTAAHVRRTIYCGFVRLIAQWVGPPRPV